MENGKRIIDKLQNNFKNIINELGKVIIGQSGVIEQVLIGLFSRGHILIEGVPGLGKTLLIKSISDVLDLKFNRIQFTPDLMPSDIIGSDIIEDNDGGRKFKFIQGPLFANVILADEINRTPPKTQSALLEAMQENQITVAGRTYHLEQPFFVMATQNPIEAAGTYPLPEAQLDRFMFKVLIFYPSEEEEKKIVLETTCEEMSSLLKIIKKEEIINAQNIIRSLPVANHIIDYAVNIVRETRIETTNIDFVRNYVSWGASPRASQYLILGAKVRAVFQGRFTPTKEDIRAIIHPTLRHRIILNFSAEAERIKAEDIINSILDYCGND